MKYGYGLLTALALSTLAVTANAASLKDFMNGNKAFDNAYNGKNAKAMAESYTEDAIVYAPNAVPVVGRENIGKLWQAFMDSGFTDLVNTTKEIGEEGKLGYETGAWAGKGKDKDGKVVDFSGDFIAVYKQGDDGKWLIHRNIWTDHPAK